MLKTILGVLLVALLAGGAYFALFAEDPTLQPPPSPETPDEGLAPTTPDQVLRSTGTTEPDRTNAGESREAVHQTTGDAADAPQGVGGRLINEGGIPVEGARVYLVRGVGVSTFDMFRRFQRGERFPPLAAGVSLRDGTFRLGFRNFEEEADLEVRILHPDYADARIERLRISPEDWTVTEDVILKSGVRVYGQVVGPSGNGLAEATVTVTPTFAHGMLSIPDRERGIVTRTDANGIYEFQHLDELNVSSVAAHAPGHSRQTQSEIRLQKQVDVKIDFTLQEAEEIGGVITDEDGKPIRGARIAAFAHSQKSPQREEAFSDAEGAFLVTGLNDGNFRLSIDAPGFGMAQEAVVPAGSLDVRIVLEKLGSVVVVVRSKRGAVNRFKCNIKPVIQGGSFGKPTLSKEIRRAKNGKAEIIGLQPNKYVAEIHAKGYAKNFSAPFEIAPGQQQSPEVEIALNNGGSLRGTVRDQNGQPVGGVRVKTMPDNMIDNPLVRAFGGVPYTISRGETKTNSKGQFTIPRLTPGSYQLEFAHRDYVTQFITGNNVRLDESTAVDPQLIRGSILSGIARVDGKPRSQVRVVLQAVQDKKAKAKALFSVEATTDSEGKFLMPKRIPPGKYEYRAAQTNAGPFQIVLQMQKKTPVDVAGEHVQIAVDLRSPKR